MAGRLRKRIGNYYVGRTIGEGTYAKVKYGEHVETGEPVAIKILEKQQLSAGGMEGYVKREILILKHLHHPNIVDLKEVMSSRDHVYLVMELITGGELFDHVLLKGPLPEGRAREVFAQLLGGLEYCHMHKIYHRDLKPENVLLTSTGDVKLSDFGLGALPTSERENGMLATTCGTPNYVAPEVLASNGYAGGPADIWSLGILLYVITAGKLPFEEVHLASLFHSTSRAAYKTPPWFTEDLISFLRLMLEPQPSKRASFDTLRWHRWMQSGSKPGIKSIPLHSIALADDIFQPTVSPRALTKEEARAVNSGPSGPKRLCSSGMNAFELMTAALDISAIFESRGDVVSRATRFTSKAGPAEITQSLATAALKEGASVQNRDTSRLKIVASSAGIGVTTASVEVMPVLPGLYMVEFTRASGSTVAFHELFKALLEECRAIVV